MRDRYTPDDPAFARWRAGHRYAGIPPTCPTGGDPGGISWARRRLAES
ncbi:MULTISPECIES: hypothetical protein [Streptomyces]